MRRYVLLVLILVVVAAMAAVLAACGSAGDAASPTPAASPPASSGGSDPPRPGDGTKMAPGLYDLEDGIVVAIGAVEYRDLEGGFWAVIGGTEAEGDAGEVVAVIANGDEFAEQFHGERGPLVRGLRQERAGDAVHAWPARRSPPRASCSRPRPGRRSSAWAAPARPASSPPRAGDPSGIPPDVYAHRRLTSRSTHLPAPGMSPAAGWCLIPSKVSRRGVRHASPMDGRIRRSDFGGGAIAGRTTL